MANDSDWFVDVVRDCDAMLHAIYHPAHPEEWRSDSTMLAHLVAILFAGGMQQKLYNSLSDCYHSFDGSVTAACIYLLYLQCFKYDESGTFFRGIVNALKSLDANFQSAEDAKNMVANVLWNQYSSIRDVLPREVALTCILIQQPGFISDIVSSTLIQDGWVSDTRLHGLVTHHAGREHERLLALEKAVKILDPTKNIQDPDMLAVALSPSYLRAALAPSPDDDTTGRVYEDKAGPDVAAARRIPKSPLAMHSVLDDLIHAPLSSAADNDSVNFSIYSPSSKDSCSSDFINGKYTYDEEELDAKDVEDAVERDLDREAVRIASGGDKYSFPYNNADLLGALGGDEAKAFLVCIYQGRPTSHLEVGELRNALLSFGLVSGFLTPRADISNVVKNADSTTFDVKITQVAHMKRNNDFPNSTTANIPDFDIRSVQTCKVSTYVLDNGGCGCVVDNIGSTIINMPKNVADELIRHCLVDGVVTLGSVTLRKTDATAPSNVLQAPVPAAYNTRTLAEDPDLSGVEYGVKINADQPTDSFASSASSSWSSLLSNHSNSSGLSNGDLLETDSNTSQALQVYEDYFGAKVSITRADSIDCTDNNEGEFHQLMHRPFSPSGSVSSSTELTFEELEKVKNKDLAGYFDNILSPPKSAQPDQLNSTCTTSVTLGIVVVVISAVSGLAILIGVHPGFHLIENAGMLVGSISFASHQSRFRSIMANLYKRIANIFK